MKHGIEWLNLPGHKGETWNPWVGCSKVSAGCENCYALRMATRLQNRFCKYARTVENGNWSGWVNRASDSVFHQPAHWRDPRAIFACSMSDFFHEGADRMREHAWHTIYDTPRHLYLILTKRPERIPQCLPSFGKKEWPWKNVWLGASVENKDQLFRVNALSRVPAALHFLSIEPMLGPLNIQIYLSPSEHLQHQGVSAMKWVIVGGESGPGARPMHPDWARGVRDQCLAARVPYFHKQNGEWLHESQLFDSDVDLDYFNAKCYGVGPQKGFARVGKKQAGHLLDGRTWEEFPK